MKPANAYVQKVQCPKAVEEECVKAAKGECHHGSSHVAEMILLNGHYGLCTESAHWCTEWQRSPDEGPGQTKIQCMEVAL